MLSDARRFASFARLRFVLLALCGAASLAACGIDGTTPYAGWATFTDSEGVYRVRYLAPPWERVAPADGGVPVEFVVPPVFGSLEAGVPAKYRLTAVLVSGLALPVLQAEVATMVAAGGDDLDPPAPFTTRSGDEGFFAVIEDSTHLLFTELVALVAPGGRVLLVHFEMNEDPRSDREAAAMLRAIDVRPFGD